MRIGDDECYLRIERGNPEDGYSPFRVEARLRLDERAEFYAFNSLVVFSSADEERSAFLAFAAFRSNRVLLSMSDGGSLELHRDVRGHIDVLFSIGCRRVGPHWKTSGDVHVDGEHTQELLRDIERLVFGSHE